MPKHPFLRMILPCAALMWLPVAAGAEDTSSLKEISLINTAEVPTIQLSLPQVSLSQLPPAVPDSLPAGGGCSAGGHDGCAAASATRDTIVIPPPKKAPAPVSKSTKTAKTKGPTLLPMNAPDSLDSGAGKKLMPGEILEGPVTILPETATTIKLSSSDVNRVICTGEVKDVLTSDEKGLQHKIVGKDVFLKYTVGKRSDGTLSYSSTPTEIFVVCNGATYNMIAFPARMPSQTIKLSSGKDDRIKDNQSLYAGLPFEKRIMRAIKEVFTDNIPESYTVTKVNELDMTWKGLAISHQRDVDIEGEGMRVKEYHVRLKSADAEPFKMTEKMFLRNEFAVNPIAVSIDKHTLRPGETSRLFIVEQRADKPLGGNGFQLPVMEGGSIAPKGAPQGAAKNNNPVQGGGKTGGLGFGS